MLLFCEPTDFVKSEWGTQEFHQGSDVCVGGCGVIACGRFDYGFSRGLEPFLVLLFFCFLELSKCLVSLYMWVRMKESLLSERLKYLLWRPVFSHNQYILVITSSSFASLPLCVSQCTVKTYLGLGHEWVLSICIGSRCLDGTACNIYGLLFICR